MGCCNNGWGGGGCLWIILLIIILCCCCLLYTSIIIGVASVVIMVSVVQGQNRQTMEMFEKLGDNKITVQAYGCLLYTSSPGTGSTR